ncbi:hypothetical protein T439DRAFT_222280 [Meredithblackwellia eburnea MCA 4105]
MNPCLGLSNYRSQRVKSFPWSTNPTSTPRFGKSTGLALAIKAPTSRSLQWAGGLSHSSTLAPTRRCPTKRHRFRPSQRRSKSSNTVPTIASTVTTFTMRGWRHPDVFDNQNKTPLSTTASSPACCIKSPQPSKKSVPLLPSAFVFVSFHF